MKRFVFCAKDNHLMTGYTTKNNDYYKCAVKGCKTNIKASELHNQYAELLNNYALPEAVIPLFKKVLAKKFGEREAMNVEATDIYKKNLATLKTKLKNIKMRFAEGEIDKEVYDEASKEMMMRIQEVEKSLEEVGIKYSNLPKYIDTSISIAS